MRGKIVKRINGLITRHDLSARTLWIAALALVGLKILLCSFQLMYASPDLSPIDDTLMVDLAKSIAAGRWLGDYNWLTLGKHSFFALWLAFLNKLGLNFLIGGQLLFAVGALLLLGALRPLFRTNLARFFVFGIVLWTPASWAEHSLRAYRDNIYPALVLLSFAGLLGAFVRYREPARRALPFYLAAGLALGAAWLSHEDNALLVPFLLCAAVLYIVFLLWGRVGQTAAKLALLAVPLALWGGCVAAWCGMNQKVYGRFIVSDFTSSEFSDAMGALARACPEDQQRYLLVPRTTRFALYEVSPTFAAIEPYLETEDIYNGYGSVPDQEINSGGIHWAIRKAAGLAGYYANPETARQFYAAVAEEVNAACDAGLLPAGAKRSGTFAPFKGEYLAPTLQKFSEQLRILAFYEQTRPTALLSIATPQQSTDWEEFLHCNSTKVAIENTNAAYFTPVQHFIYKFLNLATWLQRILLWPMLLLAGWWLCRTAASAVRGLRRKQPPRDLLGALLLLGFLLSGLLRVAAISYLIAVSFSIKGYLMYLAPACPLLLAFLAYGTAKWLEGPQQEREEHTDGKQSA